MKRSECFEGSVLISSIWSSYLPKETQRLNEMKTLGVEHIHVHTSVHATVDEFQRFVAAFPNSRIVPIHLQDRDGFKQLSPKVELKDDKE